MIVKENNEMVSVHFESILELMDFVPPAENARSFNSYINSNDENDQQRGFLGTTESYKEMIKRALVGDSGAYKIAKQREEQLSIGTTKTSLQTIKKVKRKRIKSGIGDELDINKVYQGNSDTAWSKMIRIESDVKHHLVTIFVSIGGSWKLKVNDTIWRCAAILKLNNELQAAGKSVKIIVGHGYSEVMRGTRKRLTTSITVKKYNETLSPERLAAMTNIGFHRVFGFASQDCQEKQVISHRGIPHNVSEGFMPIHLEEEIKAGHTKPIFLSGITSSYGAEQELLNASQQMSEIV